MWAAFHFALFYFLKAISLACGQHFILHFFIFLRPLLTDFTNLDPPGFAFVTVAFN